MLKSIWGKLSRVVSNSVNNHRERRLKDLFERRAANVEEAHCISELQTFSLALCSVVTRADVRPAVNLLLPESDPNKMFAGVRTAIEVGCALASKRSTALRIVNFGPELSARKRSILHDCLLKEFGYSGDVVLCMIADVSSVEFSAKDIWVCTYWTTAHSVQIASQLGVIDPRRVVYLIQDYEPGFMPWSDEFALARATYNAGFLCLINSVYLYDYLKKEEGGNFNRAFVFAPAIDLERLSKTSRNRVVGESPRLLFYARPSRTRNLYRIGITALKLAARRLNLDNIDAEFLAAGESIQSVALSPRHYLTSMGQLSWDRYFEVLQRVDIVFSLQYSPHPSHPPLDALASGKVAITNEFAGMRGGKHSRLWVAEPDPFLLADKIYLAIKYFSEGGEVGRFEADVAKHLGDRLDIVAERVLLAMD